MTFPTDARWALAKPLPVQAFPAYRLLWRPETCLAELAAAVMVCLATSIDCLENLCSLIPAQRVPALRLRRGPLFSFTLSSSLLSRPLTMGNL
jgi:hypothetical protein